MRRVLCAVPSQYLALTVVPGLFAVSFIMVRSYLSCFIIASKEGGIAEVGTVLFLLVGAALSAMNVRLAWRERNRIYTLFFGLLTLALLFGAAEELSYGQRILNIETPEFFEENSGQDEINLHNLIEGFDDGFDTLKVLERLTWAFGIVLPLIALRARIPLPSLLLVPGFFLATELMQSRVHGQEREFGELAVSIGLALFLLMEWQKRSGSGREFRLSARGLALAGVIVAAAVPAVVFAAGQGCETRFCAGRPVIERLRADIAPDVAVISVQDVESYITIFQDCNLQGPNVFRAFYLDDDPAPVNAMLDNALANYDEALGVYVGPERYDTTGLVENRLRDQAFEASTDYYDFVRVVRYGLARELSAPVALDAVFGGAIRLNSYAVDEAILSGGDVLSVALEWQALDSPDSDYTVSVRLTNSGGQLVAQHDSPPRNNTAPTSTWQAGDIIRDHHGVALPRDLAAGTYQLDVLLYNESGRLPVSVEGTEAGDSLHLREITTAAVN